MEIKETITTPESNTDETTDNSQDTAKKTGKKPKLVGCEVVLDPTQSGMLIDSANDFTFSFFRNEEGEITKDRMTVTEETDLSVIDRNIRIGILRVFKDGKDVSKKYGGTLTAGPRRPIVHGALKKPDADNNLDNSLLRVLSTNDVDQIGVYLQRIGDFATLKRLLELESLGSNPTSNPRRSVIDVLEEKIKHVSGISFGKVDGEEEEITIKTS